MLDLLLISVWVGLSSAAATVIVREAPFVRGWVLSGVKPWACDICMTLWLSGAATIALELAGTEARWAFLPGYAVGKYVLRKLTDPEGVPADIAFALEDTDNEETRELQSLRPGG